MSDLGEGSNVGGSPPRIPERLLAAVLRDPRVREDVLGDLHAAYQKYEQRSRVPGLRYWIAALDVGIRFLLPRRSTGSPAPAQRDAWETRGSLYRRASYKTSVSRFAPSGGAPASRRSSS